MASVAKGDEKAFSMVFEGYKKVFFAVAYKMTRDSCASEEIVQEVFVTLWEKRALVANSERTEGYIFAILHNTINLYFRRQAKQYRLKQKMQAQTQDSEDLIEKLLHQKEQQAIFEEVINQMPPQQKIVFKLAKQEELSRDEIAKKLDLSPNTVRNHLAAAIEFLRRHHLKGAWALLSLLIIRHL